MKNKIKLYDCFSHWQDGGVIYLYSDPHFGDREMKKIRLNYISDEEQVKRINSKVGKHDTIIFLGDIGDVNWIKKIHGYKVLIKGNHDKGNANYRRNLTLVQQFDISKLTRDDISKGDHSKAISYVPQDNYLFDEVFDGIVAINDKIVLSHQPISTLPYIFNIHGHVHHSYVPDEHHFNVCAEYINYTPVRLDEIIVERKIKDIKNIHRYFTDNAKEEIKMKYYSEKLDKNFDTVEKLKEAEKNFDNKEGNKEELIAEINEKIDEKIEEFREVEKKTQKIITEIADLVIELTNIDPAQFLRSFEIVRKLHEISDEVYSDSPVEEVENNEPFSKEEEKFDEEAFKNFLSNVIKNLNE